MITGIGMGIVVNKSNRRSISIKDVNGKEVGRISYTIKSGKKKTKRVQYNMRQISSRILRSKTSSSARMALTGAKSKVAQLKRQLKSEEFDNAELQSAITHAMKIERVAKKKMKHLQEEESAKGGGICSGEQVDQEMELEESADYIEKTAASGSDTEQEVLQEIQRDMQRKMQKAMQEEMQKAMQEEMQKLTKEAARAGGLDELEQELVSAFPEDMDPEDLEEMKKKHRNEELKDILEADMEYLKAMFNRLQKEKQSNTSSAGRSVSLQLGGAEIPVETAETAAVSDIPMMTEGTNIDYQA